MDLQALDVPRDLKAPSLFGGLGASGNALLALPIRRHRLGWRHAC